MSVLSLDRGASLLIKDVLIKDRRIAIIRRRSSEASVSFQSLCSGSIFTDANRWATSLGLRLDRVDADFGWLPAALGDGQKEPLPLGDEQRRARAGGCRERGDPLVVIR